MTYQNPYFNPYQPYYAIQQPVQQQVQQPVQNTQQPVQNNNQQNGGFIVVSNDGEIKRYPVAPGNIITFKIDGQPIIVEKSMGYSQFDSPKYKRYKMIEEDMPEDSQNDRTDTKTEKAEDLSAYVLKTEYEEINGVLERYKKKVTEQEKDISDINEDIDELKQEISDLQSQIKELKRPTPKRKEPEK